MFAGAAEDFGLTLRRDKVSLPPPLNGRVVLVAELPCHGTDTAEQFDHVTCSHADYVRCERTVVNDENVHAVRHMSHMATIGRKLSDIRRRSLLTMDAVAQRMGLKGRSSVQRFFDPDLDHLTLTDALRLADVFEGEGAPPIRRKEILGLAGAENLVEIEPNEELSPRYMDLPRDVPVYGTAMGTYRDEEGSQAIEQAFIDYSETIDYFPRLPAYADRKGIYGIYVTGPSMEPRWDQGDPAYVDPKRPPQIGDDVVVYLVKPIGDDNEPEAVLIKRLAKRSSEYVELEQYNPALRFRIESRRIRSIHRVVPRREYNGAR